MTARLAPRHLFKIRYKLRARGDINLDLEDGEDPLGTVLEVIENLGHRDSWRGITADVQDDVGPGSDSDDGSRHDSDI